jgi:hypothetical protein
MIPALVVLASLIGVPAAVEQPGGWDWAPDTVPPAGCPPDRCPEPEQRGERSDQTGPEAHPTAA